MLTIATTPLATSTIPNWVQYGCFGLVAFIVFAAVALVWTYFPKIVAAITSIGTTIAAQLETQDVRHREDRKELVGGLHTKIDRVQSTVDDLADEVRRAPSRQ